ncbi:hypothetical protein Tsubulata_037399 [Turnera subulata]|uniref:F-box domain-containing protein n=1 Tax=Turnera subulata TaxID=218843 RepID=A0A9Q0JIA8_9ROSI|nr:hypothetical protein Tsubulata_037399 [Turnera subulata]
MSSSLPLDILMEILRRLPVSSLLRFRCASQAWRSLIASSYLVKIHLARSIEENNLMIILMEKELVGDRLDSFIESAHIYAVDDDKDNGLVQIKQRFQPFESCRNRATRVHGSCNGVVLCSDCFCEQPYMIGSPLSGYCKCETPLKIWNPLTEKCYTLPPRSATIVRSRTTIHGSYFYYDASSNSHKLLAKVPDPVHDTWHLKLYNLETDRLTTVYSLAQHVPSVPKECVLVSGSVLCWTARVSGCEGDLFAFDLRTEEYYGLPLPDVSYYMAFWEVVGVFDGCLTVSCFFLEDEHMDKFAYEIWMMEEFGVRESWTKLLSFKKDYSMHDLHDPHPLAYSKKRDKVLLECGGSYSKLFWYDLNQKKLVEVEFPSVHRRSYYPAKVCVASMVDFQSN